MSKATLNLLQLIFLLIVNFQIGFSQSKIDSLKTVLGVTTDKVFRLNVLDNLTKELIRNNSEEQTNYLKEYLKLANELKEYDLLASKSRFLIQLYLNKGQTKKAQQLCDSLLNYKNTFKKESSEAHLLLKRAASFYDKEELEAAIKDYNQSSKLFFKSGDSIFAADAIFFGAQAHVHKNNFLEAIQKFKQAEELYHLLGDKQYSLLVASELTELYSRNGFVKKSIEELERLVKIARANKDFTMIVQLLGQNVVAHYKLRDYEKIELLLEEMAEVQKKITYPYHKFYCEIFILNYQLLLACEKNNIKEAKNFMSLLEEKTKKDVSPYLKTDVLAAKAKFYEVIGNEKALIPILESLSQIKNTARLDDQTKAREQLAKILTKKGRYQEVVNLYKINSEVKDSVYKMRKNNTFLYYQAEFENEKRLREITQKEAEIERLEAEQKLANTKRNTFIGVLILLFSGISLAIYVRNRQKIKEQAYQNILLNNKVATKTEEINELLTETIQHIKSKERIAENLKKLSNEKEGMQLKSVIADLRASKADDEKLLLIKQNIEQANFEFIKKLKSLHPVLTKTDIEICSFIRIGLKRKEVANIRNTSLEAVKTSRFRIKKKLHLSANDDLDTYIKSL